MHAYPKEGCQQERHEHCWCKFPSNPSGACSSSNCDLCGLPDIPHGLRALSYFLECISEFASSAVSLLTVFFDCLFNYDIKICWQFGIYFRWCWRLPIQHCIHRQRNILLGEWPLASCQLV